MKTSLIAALPLAIAAPVVASAEPSLVAHYTFDDCTATDLSGNGNHGRLVGDVTCAPGKKGNGLRFGGYYSHGYVTIPPSQSLAAVDDFTYSLWFNIESYTSMDGWGRVTDYGMHALFAKAGDREGLDLKTSRSPESGLLYLWAANGRCCGWYGRGTSGAGAFGLDGWHMATVTMGGGQLKLFVDGVLETSMASSEFMLNPLMAAMPLQLGIDEGAWWYPLDGMLDDVRVYDRALTDAEVAGLFNPYVFGGFRPPVRDDGSSVFRQGSTIPVKFQLADQGGAIVADASPTLFVAKVVGGVAGPQVEAVSTSGAVTGNLFRFDPEDEQYVLNLSTKGLEPGATYQLTVALGNGDSRSVLVSLR